MLEHESSRIDQAKKAAQLQHAYEHVFEGEDGRMVLADIIQVCDIFRTALEAREDPAAHDVRRQVGLYVLRRSGRLEHMREVMGV